MKIAIVTIVSRNYGNRLQNYALQRVLESFGYSVETLRRKNKPNKLLEGVKTAAQTLLQTKGAKFKAFDKNIHFANEVVTRDNYSDDIGSLYECFIVGSDQVWNPYYDFVAGRSDFLAFAENAQKISYAASFGVDEIPLDRKKEYAEWLKDFKAISVREKQGAKIVRELIDREAIVVLDPTLLLDEYEWKKVEKKPHCCPKGKYAFVYALGDKSDIFEEKIEQIKEKYEVFDVGMIQKNGKELPVGPSEFLYLLRNSEIVLTDSFHATVFSIIFHKRFITFNRLGLNMNSRIESLAEMVGAKNRLMQCGMFDGETEMDYVNVDAMIKRERKRSIEFLTKALNA